MAITIGSNIASLQSQRRLFDTSEKLATVFERLASGQRINRASDDAAGLAISESLRADNRVYTQAVRNFNDGQSVLNIADSTVEELSSIVIRIQELATQASSGSLSNQQRESLDIEAQELREEYFRVSREAEFNGLRLFDGSLENGLRLQGGYGTDGSILSSLGGLLGSGTFTDALTVSSAFSTSGDSGDINGDGLVDFISNHEIFIANADGTFTAQGTYTLGAASDESQLVDINSDGVLDLVFLQSDNLVSQLGNGDGTFQSVTSLDVGSGTASPAAFVTDDFNGDGYTDVVTANSNGGTSVLLGNGDGSFTYNGSFSTHDPDNIVLGDVNGDGINDVVTSSYLGGGIEVALGNGDGTFQSGFRISNEAPSYIEIGDFDGDDRLDIVYSVSTRTSILFNDGDGTSFSDTQLFGSATGSATAADFNGDGYTDLLYAGGSNGGIHLNDGSGSFTRVDTIGGATHLREVNDFNGDGVLDILTGSGLAIVYGDTREGVNPLLEFSLGTQADALQALAPLENKLNALTEQRGVIGAFQSRLQTAVNTLQATTENYAAAESRIRDADIAEESSSLARLNILRQAAASVLAQANLQPSLSLTLLR